MKIMILAFVLALLSANVFAVTPALGIFDDIQYVSTEETTLCVIFTKNAGSTVGLVTSASSCVDNAGYIDEWISKQKYLYVDISEVSPVEEDDPNLESLKKMNEKAFYLYLSDVQFIKML